MQFKQNLFWSAVVGDTIFYSQAFCVGNVSGCCCWGTTPFPVENLFIPENHNKEQELWTTEKLKQHKLQIDRGEIKEAIVSKRCF